MRILPPTNSKYRFPFEKYCKAILSVMPPSDLMGISEIRFVDNYLHPKSDKEAVASYLQGKNGKNAVIEIHMPNLIKHHTPEYLFDLHLEIAALYLSEIIAHEIGHHAHTFKRHGIAQTTYEKFAQDYARAGYYNYLISRLDRVLFSYRCGSFLYFIHNRKTRQGFAESRREIIAWLEINKSGILFP